MIAMVICHYDDTNIRGGLEKQTELLSRALRSTGEDVVVLGSTRKLSRARWTSDAGVPVRLFWTYASPQVSGRYLPASLLWALQLFLWITIHRRKISLIHLHQLRIHAFVAALSRKWYGIPCIAKSGVGGDGADINVIASRKYFGRRGRDFVLKYTDNYIATTATIRDDLQRVGVADGRISMIPNGLSVPAAPLERSEAEQRHRRSVFLGRLEPDKNAVALARAALDMPADVDLRLDFYGRGPEAERLKAAIAAGPEGRVSYNGFVKNPSDVLRSYGWLILPSNAEGLSNAMIEAMASGVVPVATRVSGCVDHIVPYETGIFLDGVDDASLASGLRAIGTLPYRQWEEMSARVQSYARERFDIRAVARSYSQLYRRLERRT
jgi:glycosyltransferase involved in cell wall biosynthesis